MMEKAISDHTLRLIKGKLAEVFAETLDRLTTSNRLQD